MKKHFGVKGEKMDYNELAQTFIHSVKKPGKMRALSRFNAYSHGEHQVIYFLFKNSGKAIMPSDIAKFTNTSTARIATILNSLEDKGMIIREISREDRRKILVSITDKGRKTAEKAYDQTISDIASVFQTMGEKRAMGFVDDFKLFLDLSSALHKENDEK